MKFTGFYRCRCGAITFVTDDKREFSCLETNLEHFLPEDKLPEYCPGEDPANLTQFQNVFSCNHCINHYGLDLCACGSGEAPDKCENGYTVCGKPMQSLERGYTSVCDCDTRWGSINTTPYVISEEDLLAAENEGAAADVASMLKDALAAAEKLRTMLPESVEGLAKRIEKDAVLDGVEPNNDTSLSYGTVKLSAIRASGKSVLSAEYYLPKSQANLVRNALTPAAERGDIVAFQKKLVEMIENTSVESVSGSVKTRHPLNSKTLEILKDFAAPLLDAE